MFYNENGPTPLFNFVVTLCFLILVQQWYARTHHYGIEQPVGLIGFADYLFRHPEQMVFAVPKYLDSYR